MLEIVGLTLRVTLSAIVISMCIGIPIGAWLAFRQFFGKRIITALIYTGMGLPPVVVGLVVFLFLSRSGPFGELGWLFTVQAMVVAQVVISLPQVIGLTMSSVTGIDPMFRIQMRSLGATPRQVLWAQMFEARYGIIVGVVAGFGRIISEVGAVILVGGNIDGRTRVLTTAIILETRQGNFSVALALGLILLLIAFLTNMLLVQLQNRTRR